MTEQQVRRIEMGGQHIPEHMIDAVLMYFNEHVRPGNFLCALLTNDFLEACARADEKNLAALPVWASLLYNLAPIQSCGSPEKVKAWLALRHVLFCGECGVEFKEGDDKGPDAALVDPDMASGIFFCDNCREKVHRMAKARLEQEHSEKGWRL